MKHFVSFVLVFLCFMITTKAQSVTFVATVDHDTIGTEDVLVVTYTLVNAESATCSVDFGKAFDLVSGPSTSSQFSMVNGQTSKKKSWSYVLRAKQKGEFEIPSASVTVNKEKVESNALLVFVKPGKVIKETKREESNLFYNPWSMLPNWGVPSIPEFQIVQPAPEPEKKARKTYRL